MNVYDFDDTIYSGDSTVSFYLFCLKKYPVILRDFPRQFWGFVKYKTGKMEKTEFKEVFFCFLKRISDIEFVINNFWDMKQCKIKKWYKNRQRQDDLIISASPEFLLTEICRRLGVENLIASKVAMETGKFLSKNCYGKEKVKRFLDEYSQTKIEKFYSDSYSDAPMAALAKEAFIVKGNKIRKWHFKGL